MVVSKKVYLDRECIAISPELPRPSPQPLLSPTPRTHHQQHSRTETTATMVKEYSDSPVYTTSNGCPVMNPQASQRVGENGPLLLQDFHLIDLLAHFDRERIPERYIPLPLPSAFPSYYFCSTDIMIVGSFTLKELVPSESSRSQMTSQTLHRQICSQRWVRRREHWHAFRPWVERRVPPIQQEILEALPSSSTPKKGTTIGSSTTHPSSFCEIRASSRFSSIRRRGTHRRT